MDGPKGKLALELAEFLESGEEYVYGEELVRRTQWMNPAGFIHAMFLYENQNLIPEECRKNYLVFPGTILLRSGGNRRVVCLNWRSGAWHWGDSLLDRAFDSGDRVVCLKA